MHISILSHQTQKHGLSSRFLVDYLEKENEGKTKDTEHLHRLAKERFFNSTTLENPDLILDKNEVISSLDKNRGSQKLKSSNYYMLNISPSKKELEHMENLAIKDLERRGIQNKKSTSLYYLEQKEALIKHQLKLYTNDVMQEYAKSMNREIYCHEDKLPDKESKKLLEEKTDKVFSDFLKEQGIIMQEALKEDPETPKTEEVSTQEQDPHQEAQNEQESTETKESEASKDKIYKRSHWINIDASIVDKDSSKKTVTLEVLLEGKYEKIIVPTTMVYPQDDGSCKVPHDFFQSKIEELEYKKLIDVQASIVEEKSKSYLIDLELQSGVRGNVYVPKGMLIEQGDGTYKMPIKMYEEKAQELLEKENQWIYVPAEVLEEKEKTYLVNLELENGIKEAVYVPKSMLREPEEGIYKMPISFYELKEKEIEDLQKKLVSVDISIIEAKEKSSRISLRLSENVQAEIQVPNHVLKKQQDGSYKMPEEFYQSKFKEVVNSRYSQEKQKIYEEVAQKNGFDVSKRALTGDDLLWYGKVEQTRTYKFSDTAVKYNKELEGKISSEKSEKERVKLIDQLLRDKDTGAIIREGVTKGGSQYHVHVMVSRHDKTMKDSRNKLSLSPLANARDSKIGKQGAQVGFNRDVFYQKCESLFDEKFDFQRQHSYEQYKQRKDHLRSLRGEGKRFLSKHTGINKIKQELMPFQKIKDQLGIANIPTSFPTSITREAVKVVRKIIDKGLEY